MKRFAIIIKRLINRIFPRQRLTFKYCYGVMAREELAAFGKCQGHVKDEDWTQPSEICVVCPYFKED